MTDLVHEGVKRRSGRYPWGSGENPYQHESWFTGFVSDMRATGMSDIDIVKTLKKNGLSDVDTIRLMRKQGLKDTDISKGLGISTTVMRQRISLDNEERKAADAAMAVKLKNKGYSNTAIAERLNVSEGSVRNLLKNFEADKQHILKATADSLKSQVDEKGVIDIGVGVERWMGISRTKLLTSVSLLKEEGYSVYWVPVQQMGTGEYTNTMVLAKNGISFYDIKNDVSKIKAIREYSEDGGRTFTKIEKPRSVDSKEIQVVYAEQGGSEKDGLIELRRGVDYISLGDARYAQVRIAVDGTHYLKGMALYSDDLPPGVNIRFNTNKHEGTPKLKVLKEMEPDPEYPFGASIKDESQLMLAQRHYISKDGKRELSAINIVNEEGDWRNWKSSLSAQFLSKQSPQLISKQLELTKSRRRAELDSIESLTNPVVKKKMLDSYADDADAAAVHLKAAGLPRQASHVILPFPSIKDNEVYAPNYKNGEDVVLIRYPHGGKFEIASVKVNNKNKDALKALGNAPDAIGINSKVAAKMSGADFDGDTVLVIPNNTGAVKSSATLKQLENFDPKQAYPKYEGMKIISEHMKQKQMGVVSNLITDMTIKGAGIDEIARAVKHSMVIIDSKKHELNWKQSEIDNGIQQLKDKYQSGGGASTLVSRAGAEVYVPEKKEVINKETGAKELVDTGGMKKVYKTDKKTGEVVFDKEVPVMEKRPQMSLTPDANTLSSGTRVEALYAEYANGMKSMANEARKASLSTKMIPYSPTAKQTYASEVEALDAKLNAALKNAPLERQAQVLANANVRARMEANPSMSKDSIKKAKGQELTRAREVVGANKTRIYITDKEWDAIQAGAISSSKLTKIINNADLERVKALATPKDKTVISTASISKAKTLMSRGYTQAEAAAAIGVSVSTLLANL